MYIQASRVDRDGCGTRLTTRRYERLNEVHRQRHQGLMHFARIRRATSREIRDVWSCTNLMCNTELEDLECSNWPPKKDTVDLLGAVGLSS